MSKKKSGKRKGKSDAAKSSTIALNRKIRHDYTIEEKFEAGIVLEGWEVKSIRLGKVQIADSYVILKKREAFLVGAVVQPLTTTCVHMKAEPDRTRKLLLNKREINKLVGHVERKGYTLVPTCMYWKRNRVKVEIALAKGKKSHDVRADVKARDWQREKQRILKRS